MTSQVFFERSEKTFWNNVLLVLVNSCVSLSCYQASTSQKVGDNFVKINMNMQFTLVPFMKKRKEEITELASFYCI